MVGWFPFSYLTSLVCKFGLVVGELSYWGFRTLAF